MHSAEHLLNGTMVKMFGCDRSFSAHINKKKSKCDYRFERALSDEEVSTLETQINQVIQQDLPVKEEFIGREDASERYDLKRLPEHVTDTVRIVHIGDYDAIPCIGDHIDRSGQIGTFRITTTSFEEGILRIRFKLEKPDR